jgi:transposase
VKRVGQGFGASASDSFRPTLALRRRITGPPNRNVVRSLPTLSGEDPLSSHLREGAYDATQLIPIVQALGQLVGGAAPVVLVWDNLPAHTSLVMRAFLADQHAWLQVEYLPAYAPDLNPVEGLWANLKEVELANRACGSLEELAAAAEQGVGRVRGESELLFSFLHQAGLSL